MKGLDTNALVRLLVADHPAQTERIASLLQAAEVAGERFFVSSLVLLELVWVLDSAYGCARTEILDALERLAAMPVLHLDHLDAVHRAITYARKSKQEIDDLLIGCCAAAAGCTAVMTFDRSASRHELFELL
ncbi:MAG: PIN domain-containing protein [Candidatus Latescibacterota bacterium]|jgi:predicted nucleic-acid-binding protein